MVKEDKKEEPEIVAGLDGQKVKVAIIHNAKLVGAALAIWTIGWLGMHYLWVLMGLLIFAIWNMNKKEKENRMQSLLEITRDEQKVLARRRDLPSWVDFPDMQRAEWLNEIIFQIWPYVDKMVQQILKEKVEPRMQERLPSIIKSLYFEKINLGDQAPKLGGIKVFSKNIERSEIIMDCDFIYAGDAVIKVKARGVSAGITNLQVRGRIRFEFNPLVSQPPLIGGIAVYFLDNPEFNFDLTDLLNILDIPGLSDILHGVVKDAISNFLVLPNRIKIPLSSTADLEQLKYPLPEGVLRITVIEAENLLAKDINVFSKDTSDPYAVLTVGCETMKTSAKEETLNPVWNETFEVFVEKIHGRKLKVQLFDHDIGSADENLGSTEISIEKIAKNGSSEFWLPLEGVKSGKIHMKLDWLKFSNKASNISQTSDKDFSTSALFIKLDSAKNLPVTNKDDDTSNPFCTITVGNQIETSKKLSETARPVWEQLFQFLIKNPKQQELNVQVHDWKHDTPIGRLDLSIDRLLKNREMRFKQPFHLTDAAEDSTLTMIIELKALVPSRSEKTKIVGLPESIGEIEETIKWDSDSNKLIIDVHKARDLASVNDERLETFVELNLLPDKSDAGSRQTNSVKDKDPKYDEKFSFFIGYDEAKARSLKTTIINLRNGKKNEKVVIGEVIVKLDSADLINGPRKWYRLNVPVN